MKTSEYQEQTKRTLNYCENRTMDMIHMLLGISSETGELHDQFKRSIAYGLELDKTNIKEEIGDILWYLSNLCNISDITLEECMYSNIKKLYVRYPEKFSQENAIIRNISEERKKLEE